MFGLNKKAQSTAEYAIIIAVVIGALVAMQVYMKRGVQGKFRDAVDDLATNTGGLVPGNKTTADYDQFEPLELERTSVSAVDSDTTEGFNKETTSRTVSKDGSTRSLEQVYKKTW